MAHEPILVSIDLRDGPNTWRLRMYKGKTKIGEATCPSTLTEDELIQDINLWGNQVLQKRSK